MAAAIDNVISGSRRSDATAAAVFVSTVEPYTTSTEESFSTTTVTEMTVTDVTVAGRNWVLI